MGTPREWRTTHTYERNERKTQCFQGAAWIALGSRKNRLLAADYTQGPPSNGIATTRRGVHFVFLTRVCMSGYLEVHVPLLCLS